MGNDVDVFISEKFLREKGFDLDGWRYLIEKISGIRWYNFAEMFGFEKRGSEPMHSKELLTIMALGKGKVKNSEDRERWTRFLQLDLIFAGDYNYTEHEGYVEYAIFESYCEDFIEENIGAILEKMKKERDGK